MGAQASGIARLEQTQPSQVPCPLLWVRQCSLFPIAFLLTQQLVATMVSCAASLLVDVADKKLYVLGVPLAGCAGRANCTYLACRV